MQRLLPAALATLGVALLVACGGGSTPKQATEVSTVTGSPSQAIAPPVPPTPDFVTPTPLPGTPPVGGTPVRIDAPPGQRLPNPAPIRDASLVLQGAPPKYVLHVVAGLLAVCGQPGGSQVTRDDTTFRVTVTNLLDPNLTCQLPETTYDVNLELPGPFASGTTYTVNVNGKLLTFTPP